MSDDTMQGVFPILQIPFDSRGGIIEEDLRKQVDWALRCGVEGVGIAMGSEIYKLTDAERDDVLKIVVNEMAGRGKVVMNSGAEGTDVAIDYSRRAEKLGADALMVRPPTYVNAGTEEVVRYFVTIAESVGIPIFIQDQATAAVPPALAVRLAGEHDNIRYAKMETPPTVPRVEETVKLRGDTGLVIFGGANGTFFIEELRRGAVGTMPPATMPDVFVRLWKMWQEGRELEAENQYNRYAALNRCLNQGQGISLWLYKEMLVRRGIFRSAHVRPPARRPDEAHVQEFRRIFEELGLSSV